jgi:hypothetical protein
LAASSLILASKLNDVTKKDLTRLIDILVNKFRFDCRKDLISYEFSILLALKFNLIIKYESEFVSHYERLTSNQSNNLNFGIINSYGKSNENQNSNISNFQND